MAREEPQGHFTTVNGSYPGMNGPDDRDSGPGIINRRVFT